MSKTVASFIGHLAPDGQTFDARPDQPLLLSLEAAGIPWPNSCRNGTCRTCIGQLVQGRVHYRIAWPGLSVDEKDEGCVLPCVAYPDTSVVLRDPGA
jgi:ferredoxin